MCCLEKNIFCSCNLTFGLHSVRVPFPRCNKPGLSAFPFISQTSFIYLFFFFVVDRLLTCYRQTALYACFSGFSFSREILLPVSQPVNSELTLVARSVFAYKLLLANLPVELRALLCSDKACSVLPSSYSLFSLGFLPQISPASNQTDRNEEPRRPRQCFSFPGFSSDVLHDETQWNHLPNCRRGAWLR